MRLRQLPLFFFTLFAPAAAMAQVAAETAIITSGTGGSTGRAARGLGAAMAGAMGNAANAVATANRRSGSGYAVPVRSSSSSRPRGDAHFMIALPGNVDPLERTDAPRYTLANGATLRVSGGLRRPAPSCTADCSR